MTSVSSEISIREATVDFKVYGARSRSLKNRLVDLFLSKGGQGPGKETTIRALNGVSLCLKPGDRLGVVGPNGSGKTTLLRLMAGIYEPSRGSAVSTGRVASIIDLGFGLDQEATGYENIILRGLYLGLSPAELKARTPEIAEFSGLGGSLAYPLRTYSSGMILRLAFSVCTCLEPDILLMDEWLTVGDLEFIEKARQRVTKLWDRSEIVVLASHSGPLIRRLCNRAVMLLEGEIRAQGETEEVLSVYRSWVREKRQGLAGKTMT